MRPLDGILVVAIEQAVSAPFASRQLADLGARVIKIERPGEGDFARKYDTTVGGLSSYFVWLNRSKESLTLDLKHAAGAEVLDRLLTRADVFIQNLAPGAVERLGLGWAALHARHPSLIICDISGYGEGGPATGKKAYDLLVQSEAGLLSITGTPDCPSKAGISVADSASGMYAYSGVLAALLQRNRTGQGARVEIAMLEALGEWMSAPLHFTRDGGRTLPRSGASHASIAPYGPFACGDDQAVYLGIQNEREWNRFCADVLHRPELAADERFASNSARVQNREALDAVIRGVFAACSSAELLELLDAAQIATARMNSVAEFAAHPQLEARQRWSHVPTPAGLVRVLAPPGLPAGVTPRMDPVPALGEHTHSVLAELGYDDETIQAWRAAGVV
jgi:crotonobetainyl-CoA:carnitine CoA-transferase CaiB-like acyl-CoA transferase